MRMTEGVGPALPKEGPLNWPKTRGTEWKGTSISTTQVDDALAHTELWDQRTLNGLSFTKQTHKSFEDRGAPPGIPEDLLLAGLEVKGVRQSAHNP